MRALICGLALALIAGCVCDGRTPEQRAELRREIALQRALDNYCGDDEYPNEAEICNVVLPQGFADDR